VVVLSAAERCLPAAGFGVASMHNTHTRAVPVPVPVVCVLCLSFARCCRAGACGLAISDFGDLWGFLLDLVWEICVVWCGCGT
jgi:hypothetical protein